MERILQEIIKEITLGTSDAWAMRRSSHHPSNSAYYIEDCRILDTSDFKLEPQCRLFNNDFFLVAGHFNHLIFIPRLSQHRGVELNSSWLKNLVLKSSGLKIRVEKSRVDMFCNPLKAIAWTCSGSDCGSHGLCWLWSDGFIVCSRCNLEMCLSRLFKNSGNFWSHRNF